MTLNKWSRCGGDDSWGFRRCWLQKATFEVQDSHANLARVAFSRRDLAIPHRELYRPGGKEGEGWILNKWSRCGCPSSRGVCARKEERRDRKRKISLENVLLCPSPRRDLAIPRGGVARGGYPRKSSFPPPRPLSKSKSTPPLRFRGKKRGEVVPNPHQEGGCPGIPRGRNWEARWPDLGEIWLSVWLEAKLLGTGPCQTFEKLQALWFHVRLLTGSRVVVKEKGRCAKS